MLKSMFDKPLPCNGKGMFAILDYVVHTNLNYCIT
jgi:hypothetical protein